jgi:hypothetical protein
MNGEDAAKKRLKRLVYTPQDILKHLRVDITVLWSKLGVEPKMDIEKPPMWAGETATSYFPVELPLKYRES